MREGTTLSLDYEIDGSAEIIGIALETNNSLTASKVLKFAGTQNFGNNLDSLLNENTNGRINIELSKYHLGTLSYIVFILDNDEIERIDNKTTVAFSNLEVTTLKNSTSEKDTLIPIGIKN